MTRIRREFELEHFRGLCVFVPPPYLTGWPLLRGIGAHFLIVMKKR
jgi:hypothetical protein